MLIIELFIIPCTQELVLNNESSGGFGFSLAGGVGGPPGNPSNPDDEGIFVSEVCIHFQAL